MVRPGLWIFVLVLIMGFTCGRAFALTIDFRDTVWSSANFQSAFTWDNVTLTASPSGATLWQDTTDGIGIRYSYENDEIEDVERLIVSFLSPVRLYTIGISDLFYESRSGQWYNETGAYSIDHGSTWSYFTAPDTNLPSPTTNGEVTISTSGVVVTDLWFKAPGYVNAGSYTQDHEFSLQTLDVSPVPETSTLVLFMVGLIVIAVALCIEKTYIFLR